MYPLLGMPQGSEWIIILVIVVLLFGSSKLPQLVRQLGKSKKIWEEEVSTGKKGELPQNTSSPSAEQQTQQPVQQPQPQPNVNGDGTPPAQNS